MPLLAGALLLPAGLVAAAAGGSAAATSSSGKLTASAPGITSSTITIGLFTSLTGPNASKDGTPDAVHSTQWMPDYINAHGGIDGRKLVVKLYDSGGGNPATVASSFSQAQGNIFMMMSLESSTGTLLAPLASQYKMPLLPQNIDAATARNNPYVFATVPYDSTDGRLGAEYMAHQLKAAKHHEGVAFEYLAGADGQQGAQTFDANARQLGLDDVGDEAVPSTATTCTDYQTKLRDAGAKIIEVVGGGAFTPCVLNADNLLGYNPTIIGAGYSFVSDIAALETHGLSNNFVGLYYQAPSTSKIGKKILSSFASYDPSYSSYTALGVDNLIYYYGLFTLIAQGLKDAGRNPTVSSFEKAMHTEMTGWSNGVFPPSNWSGSENLGPKAVSLVKTVYNANAASTGQLFELPLGKTTPVSDKTAAWYSSF